MICIHVWERREEEKDGSIVVVSGDGGGGKRKIGDGKCVLLLLSLTNALTLTDIHAHLCPLLFVDFTTHPPSLPFPTIYYFYHWLGWFMVMGSGVVNSGRHSLVHAFSLFAPVPLPPARSPTYLFPLPPHISTHTFLPC